MSESLVLYGIVFVSFLSICVLSLNKTHIQKTEVNVLIRKGMCHTAASKTSSVTA